MNSPIAAARPRSALNVTLWIVQILLAFAFGAAGLMKLIQPLDALAASMAWVSAVPGWLVRFIGAAELAGAIGLVLPALTRVQTHLTSFAGLGLVLVMILAAAFHASRGEVGMVPANVALAALAAFVAWGRLKAAPIGSRR